MNVLIEIGIKHEGEIVLGPATKSEAYKWLRQNDFKRVTARGKLWRPKGNLVWLHGVGSYSPMDPNNIVAVIPINKLKDYRACDAAGNSPTKISKERIKGKTKRRKL